LRSGISVIVLAAGAGSRFGGGKLLAEYRGRPLIEATLLRLREAPADETIVVVGNDAEGLRGLCESYGVRLAENPDWAEGMATSVKEGLAACSPDADAAVVVLGDQPLVGAKAVERLVEAYEGGAAVAVATYGGERRNPALFTRRMWPMLEEELSGDEGARGFLRRHPEMVAEVPCDDVADPTDVDTVEDLRSLEARGPGKPMNQKEARR
jgi:CTP:molybdopterin cytidylyltransferase MocA